MHSRSSLYRAVPCQNIADAEDGAWQSPARNEITTTRSSSSQAEDTSFTKEDCKQSAMLPKIPQSIEAGYSYGQKEIFANRRIPDEKVVVAQSRRGVVNSKSTPSFRDNRTDCGLEIRELNDFDQPSGKENQSGTRLGSSKSHKDEFSAINFKTPLTPGPARRSAIPVRGHRRSSSASADDDSGQLSFLRGLGAGDVGGNRQSLTPAKGQTSLTPRKTDDSRLSGSAKQFSSRRIEGMSMLGNSSFKTPLNVRPGSQLNKGIPSQMTSGNSDALPTSLFARTTPNASTAMSGLKRSSASKIPAKTMSQPGSRSASPSGKYAHLMFREPGTVTPVSTRPMSARTGAERHFASHLRPSRIPRSQGHSRDTSPSRSSEGAERSRIFYSNHGSIGTPQKMSLLSGRLLLTGSEMEQTLTDALVGTLALRRDDTSETSSISSDISQTHLNPILIAAEIIAMMSSASYSERRLGLYALQRLMKANLVLNPAELKRVTEIFTRMFHDPNSKVFNVFLETLVDVLEVHAEDMVDWLYTCLSRLLNKFAVDMLASVQAKIHKALQAISSGFSFDDQMAAIARFLAEQSLASNLMVKLAILDHLREMTQLTEPYEFVSSESCQQVTLRIVQWTNEPKSSEIRKAAQGVVVALFNLNTPEFSVVLSRLPRSIQDCARRILHNHMFSVSHQVEPQPTTKPEPTSKSVSSTGDDETDQMSCEDYFASLKKTSEDIQNLNSIS